MKCFFYHVYPKQIRWSEINDSPNANIQTIRQQIERGYLGPKRIDSQCNMVKWNGRGHMIPPTAYELIPSCVRPNQTHARTDDSIMAHVIYLSALGNCWDENDRMEDGPGAGGFYQQGSGPNQ